MDTYTYEELELALTIAVEDQIGTAADEGMLNRTDKTLAELAADLRVEFLQRARSRLQARETQP